MRWWRARRPRWCSSTSWTGRCSGPMSKACNFSPTYLNGCLGMSEALSFRETLQSVHSLVALCCSSTCLWSLIPADKLLDNFPAGIANSSLKDGLCCRGGRAAQVPAVLRGGAAGSRCSQSEDPSHKQQTSVLSPCCSASGTPDLSLLTSPHFPVLADVSPSSVPYTSAPVQVASSYESLYTAPSCFQFLRMLGHHSKSCCCPISYHPLSYHSHPGCEAVLQNSAVPQSDKANNVAMQAPAAPAEGQRAGLSTRPRSHAALSGVESSGLVTLTESAEDAAGADDAEMEEEVVGDLQNPVVNLGAKPSAVLVPGCLPPT